MWNNSCTIATKQQQQQLTHDIWFFTIGCLSASKQAPYTHSKHNGASWNGKAQPITTATTTPTTASEQRERKVPIEGQRDYKIGIYIEHTHTHFYFILFHFFFRFGVCCVCVLACLRICETANDTRLLLYSIRLSVWMITACDCGRIAFQKPATHKNSKKWDSKKATTWAAAAAARWHPTKWQIIQTK